MTIRVAVHGAAGRMGRAVVDVLRATEGVELAAAIDSPACDVLGVDAGALAGGEPLGVPVTKDVDAGLAASDVVIDFSLPEGTVRLLRACAASDKPAVVGTTGLADLAAAAVDALAARAPVVVAPNMSVGVTALFHLAARAAELLGPSFDAEIVEIHHRHKVDAPSGTAAKLADVVARAKGLDPGDALVYGRSGRVGERRPDEVGVMTLRGGDVVGEHTLVLAGPGERVELVHRAHGRHIFARGAVRAARWVVEREPGRYDMADVVGVPR
jgi:4-hydroxy-tetrahydrodipicolinate reductase